MPHEPRPAPASPARALASTSRDPGAGALQAIAPGGSPMVRVEVPLALLHAPPRWERPVRLAILVAAGLWLPVSGGGLIAVLVALWVVSGLVVRYRVRLDPGRALFKGGLSNTSEPGRYWLRRRWFGNAHSIPLETLRLDWRPAPTRIEGAAEDAWLELRLEIWVRPGADPAGQFTALMNYGLWHQHPGALARQLREEVVGALVEHLGAALELGRVQDGAIAIGEDQWRPPLDEGLHRLGLQRVATGRGQGWLRRRTEDLSSEDWLTVDGTPAPEAEAEPRPGG